MRSKVNYYNRLLFLPLMAAIILFPKLGIPETVSLSLTLDYPILRTLVIKTAFTDPGHSATLLDRDDGCKRIIVSEPRFERKDGFVLFETKVFVRIGAYVNKACILPIEWEGYVTLIQRPRINSQWILSFETVDSIIYDKNRKRATIAGIIWNYVKTSVYSYLRDITINLAPPVTELKSFLEDVFPEELSDRANKRISAIRPGEVNVTPDAVKIDVFTEVEGVEKREREVERERISEENLRKFSANWEVWDAFFVRMISSLSGEPLTVHERQILMNILLETRHRFVAELVDETLGKDFVREQFVLAWKEVSPIFRNHLGKDPSRSILSYLAFFTASDALVTLDRIGPALGLEISRNGLIRLANMISEGKPYTLDYGYVLDTTLRETLGLGPPPPTSVPPFEGEWIPMEPGQGDGEERAPLLDVLTRFLFPPAWAEGQGPDDLAKGVRDWIVKEDNLEPYLERVKAILKESASKAVEEGKIQDSYHDLFLSLSLATAWQESCFRQFKEKNNKITYILSYNGTSVGMMQINERVWRGIYDHRSLRWDIAYNAMAGCEILALYMRQYALMKMKEINPQGNLDKGGLAGLVYAMYNGGPEQLGKFLQRKRGRDYYLSEKLFFKKYQWVESDQWEKLKECL